MAVIRIQKWSAAASIASILVVHAAIVGDITGLSGGQLGNDAGASERVRSYSLPPDYADSAGNFGHVHKTVIWPGKDERPIGNVSHFPNGDPDEIETLEGCRYCIDDEPDPDWETLTSSKP